MGEEGEQWDDEQWEEDGAADDAAVESKFEEDGSDVPRDGEPVADDAPTSKAVCCKCGREASNGETVYSCSTGGSCRKCKKYGGQKSRKVASSERMRKREKRGAFSLQKSLRR